MDAQQQQALLAHHQQQQQQMQQMQQGYPVGGMMMMAGTVPSVVNMNMTMANLPRTSSARTLREPFLSPTSRSASRPASNVWVPPVVPFGAGYREGGYLPVSYSKRLPF